MFTFSVILRIFGFCFLFYVIFKVFLIYKISKLVSLRKNVVNMYKYLVTCIHFNFQLTHTTLKNLELLKHFKISKTAPTCFGLQGNRNMLEQFYLF